MILFLKQVELQPWSIPFLNCSSWHLLSFLQTGVVLAFVAFKSSVFTFQYSTYSWSLLALLGMGMDFIFVF